jgi:hypothetical protein
MVPPCVWQAASTRTARARLGRILRNFVPRIIKMIARPQSAQEKRLEIQSLDEKRH